MSGAGLRPPATSAPPAQSGDRSALLVVQIGPPELLDRGPATHRTLQPCRALGELADLTVVSGFTLSPALYSEGLLLAADVLVLREVAEGVTVDDVRAATEPAILVPVEPTSMKVS